MNKLYSLFLGVLLLVPAAPVMAAEKEEDDSYKGSMGLVNRGIDLAIGSASLIAASLFYPAAKGSYNDAIATPLVAWILDEKKRAQLFDDKVTPEEKNTFKAYGKAIIYSSIFFGLAGFGARKITKATGLTK